MEQHDFLENAPEDISKEYSGTLSHVTILNIKVGGKKTGLELENIDLEMNWLCREKLKVGVKSRCIATLSCGCVLDEFSDYFNKLMGNPPKKGKRASHASATMATKTAIGGVHPGDRQANE